MAQRFFLFVLLGFVPLPVFAQLELPDKETLPKAEFRADSPPTIVEVELRILEWSAPKDDAAKVVSELSGSAAEVTQRLEAMEKQGQLTAIQQIRLTTVDGNGATTQLSEQRPRVTGSNVTARGITVNNIMFEHVGTLVSVVPHVHKNDMVTLELNLLKSVPRVRTDAPEIGESPTRGKVKAESRATLTIRTAVRCANNQVAVIAGVVGKDERYLVLASVKLTK